GCTNAARLADNARHLFRPYRTQGFKTAITNLGVPSREEDVYAIGGVSTCLEMTCKLKPSPQ
ncbi:MAG: hypothetical protein ACRD3W_23820, partial [Terriglobales bacterium]